MTENHSVQFYSKLNIFMLGIHVVEKLDTVIFTIVFCKPDKGNGVVILNKAEYDQNYQVLSMIILNLNLYQRIPLRIVGVGGWVVACVRAYVCVYLTVMHKFCEYCHA